MPVYFFKNFCYNIYIKKRGIKNMKLINEFYEIEALSYHYGLTCEEVRNMDWEQEEIERACYYYDGIPTGGGKKEEC
jgi:hypothetical protein